MSKRAERLREFLENAGWEVEPERWKCSCCVTEQSGGPYCVACGNRMEEKTHDTEAFLDNAIAYAVGEKDGP